MTDDDESLADRVERWMVGQMPIIRMHGGNSVVREADPDTGAVVVELGGTCSHCAISSLTAQNIKADLVRDFPEVDDVTVRVPETGEMTADTVEGGRGGDLSFSDEPAQHI